MGRTQRLMLAIVGLAATIGAAAREPSKNQQDGLATPKVQPVTVELIAENTSIQPGGHTRVGVLFRIAEGWHIYAQDPGDAGLPTKVGWWGFALVKFGPLKWPPAEDFLDPGNIHTHGYTGQLILTSAIQIVGNPPAVPLSAHVEWLACREICLPGKADLSLTLPVHPSRPALSPHSELFNHVS